MPLVVFNFEDAAGVTDTVKQTADLLVRPPRNARFFLRQVSATNNQPFSNTFKYVNVYLPQLMTNDGRAVFHSFSVDSSGNIVPTPTERMGLRYYLTDHVSQPFAVNAFPNLALGRHDLTNWKMDLFVTAIKFDNTIATLNSFSIVVEWDTE